MQERGLSVDHSTIFRWVQRALAASSGPMGVILTPS